MGREGGPQDRRLARGFHRGEDFRKLADAILRAAVMDEDHPGSPLLHDRLWKDPIEGKPAPFMPVENVPPTDALSPEFPMRLTTGRRLESFNTGVQTGGYNSPLHRGESLDLCRADADKLGVTEGEVVRIFSRRGSIEAPVHLDESLKPGLAFMTMHFPDEVETNILTIDAWDPKSGTAEFKASAIRVEKITSAQRYKERFPA